MTTTNDRGKTWHHLTEAQVLHALTASRHGLDDDEVKRRVKRYGFNVLPRLRRFSATAIFFNQIRSPVVTVLLVALAVILVTIWGCLYVAKRADEKIDCLLKAERDQRGRL